VITADGRDLSFVRVRVADVNGLTAPRADNAIQFSVAGPGEIVATDNGDPTSLVPFSSHVRPAFSGLCLVIVRAKSGQAGRIVLTASSDGLRSATTIIIASPGGA
jgi:beta-galactosidase